MLTSFGAFVRKLRIERGLLLKDMADMVGVSPAFLSSVETGKKSIPAGWAAVIETSFELGDAAGQALRSAIDESQRLAQIDLSDSTPDRRRVAVAFARDFNRLSEQQLEQVRKAMATALKKEK